MLRKLITSSEARQTPIQHTSPCSDCPFRRDSLPGWLGGNTPLDFVRMAHSETSYRCHAKIGPHCAGLAIFRANVLKELRDRDAFRLPPDKKKVFSGDNEFIEYHNKTLVRWNNK